MPKNGGGKKFKRGKKFSSNQRQRELPEKAEGQQYAVLTAKRGDCRFDCMTANKQICSARVPGSFRKRVWCNVDDIVLVSVRPYDPTMVDILYKYNHSEAEQLKRDGQLPMLDDPNLIEEDIIITENNEEKENEEEEQNSDGDDDNDIMNKLDLL